MTGLSSDVQEFVAKSHEPITLAESVASEKGSHIEIGQEPDDGLYEGLELPTEHEIASLRRVPDTIPLNTFRKSSLSLFFVADLFYACVVIAFVELAERFSYYGSSVVFVSYLQSLLHSPCLTVSKTNFIQHPLPPGSRTGAGGHDGQSGALGMQQRASTGLTTFYQFW